MISDELLEKPLKGQTGWVKVSFYTKLPNNTILRILENGEVLINNLSHLSIAKDEEKPILYLPLEEADGRPSGREK